MIKLLIADDHPIVRKGLIDILGMSVHSFEFDEAENGREVLEKIRTNKYDVVVLDIDMPDMHGIEVLKLLKEENQSLPVLVLSRYPEEQYAMRIIKAGANGFLTKGRPPEELIKAIIKSASGNLYISPTLAEKMAANLRIDSDEKPHEKLSDREFQVMLEIAKGKSLQQIADEMSLGVTTISTFRKRVLEKMNLESNAQIIYYAIKEGFVEY